MVEDWKRVVWSDECSVEKSCDPRAAWVFWTPSEKYLPECVEPGAFVPLIMPSVNSELYLDVLKELLPSVLDAVPSHVGRPIFQQDNSSVHTARIIKAWLKRQGFEMMMWPPTSPDMNPIEHVWKRLKEMLQALYPDIKDTRGGADKVKGRLAEVLPIVWEQMDKEFLKKLVESMPRRVKALIRAKGWCTGY